MHLGLEGFENRASRAESGTRGHLALCPGRGACRDMEEESLSVCGGGSPQGTRGSPDKRRLMTNVNVNA